MSARDRRGGWWPWGLLALLAVLLSAPLWILWSPGAHRWRDHAYRTLLYGQVAQRVTQHCATRQEVLDRLAEYVQTHLWTPGDAVPYDGTPADNLIRGIGWCDYQAKTYAILLATRDIPARYAMLLEAGGNSPHTVAEVRQGDRWGVYDVLFGVRFVDDQGRPLTLEALSAAPGLLDRQPLVARLGRQWPDNVAGIHAAYDKVLPLAVPPRRSRPGTQSLSPFDRLLLFYARIGGPRFVAWYQDQYLASEAWARAATPADRLRLARHWDLAGRTDAARTAYRRCIQDTTEITLASEARVWLGLLEWEAGHPTAAARVFQELTTQEPNSRWNPMAWYYMGRSAEALDQPAQARTWYAQSADYMRAAWPRLIRLNAPPMPIAQ